MNKFALEFYNAQLQKIEVLGPCMYRLARYTIGHQQLIVLVEPLQGGPPKFIVFAAVKFIQTYPSWKEAPFKFLPPADYDPNIKRIKATLPNQDNTYHVFLAQAQDRQIIVICSTMYVGDNMPDLHEYQP